MSLISVSAPCSSLPLTRDLEIEITHAPHAGYRGRLLPAGDALTDATLSCYLHGEGTPCGHTLEAEGQPTSNTHWCMRTLCFQLTFTNVFGMYGKGIVRRKSGPYLGHAPQQSGWTLCMSLAPWGSKTLHRCRPPCPLSGCPPYWGPRW